MCEYHDRQRDICRVLHASDNENYATDKNMKMGWDIMNYDYWDVGIQAPIPTQHPK